MSINDDDIRVGKRTVVTESITDGAAGLDVTVLMMVLTTVTWDPDSAGTLLISFVVVLVTVSCWLAGYADHPHIIQLAHS